MYITCHEVNAFKDGYNHSFHVFIYKEEVQNIWIWNDTMQPTAAHCSSSIWRVRLFVTWDEECQTGFILNDFVVVRFGGTEDDLKWE